jgi:lysozyme
MKLIFIFIFIISPLYGNIDKNLRSHIIKYEGWRDSVYLCSAGFKTVGGGTNLEARGLANKYEVGDKIDKTLLDKWLEEDLEAAKQIARKQFKSFNSQPQKIQIILISLSYNLGRGGIAKFVKFTSAIDNKNYRLAADELINSKWYRQTGKRGRDYVNELQKF